MNIINDFLNNSNIQILLVVLLLIILWFFFIKEPFFGFGTAVAINTVANNNNNNNNICRSYNSKSKCKKNSICKWKDYFLFGECKLK